MSLRGRVARSHTGSRVRLACGLSFYRLARIQNWIYLFGAILFEKDAEQLESCHGNDEKAAGDANHKSPTQQMCDDTGQESKHFWQSLRSWAFYHQRVSLPPLPSLKAVLSKQP